MSEALPDFRGYADHLDGVSGDQYGGGRIASNVRARWETYKHVAHPIDISGLAIESLGLNGTETVLDLGCADGNDLVRLRGNYQHSGQIIGIDIDPDMFAPLGLSSVNEGALPVQFIAGKAQRLPLSDQSVDAAMALFMLYHVPHPVRAVSELARVLRPGGQLVVATSGETNKRRHRKLEAIIGECLGAKPPRVFSEPFNDEKAKEILPKYFDIREYLIQDCEMVIGPEAIDDYIASLMSMKDSYKPVPRARELMRVMEKVVRPHIESEISVNGYFSDWVNRHLFVCRKKPRLARGIPMVGLQNTAPDA